MAESSGNPESGNPESGNPESGNPESGNPESGNPESGNPESGNPESGNPRDGEKKVDVKRTAALAILALFALLSILTTALTVYPFHPYAVFSTHVIPPVACPGDEVSVRADLEIEAGAYPFGWDVSRIEIESAWTNVRTGERVGGGTGTIYDPEPRGRSVVTSDVVRDAPDEPGGYRLDTVSEVYGTFGGGPFAGWPKTQEEEYSSEDATTVLPEDDERCS